MKAKTVDSSLIASIYFSKGRDADIIDAVAKRISDTPSCRLVNVHPNSYYDRTNILFCGPSKKVVAASLNIAEEVFSRVRLSERDEELSALGSLDLVSFLPFCAAEMDHAKKAAEEFSNKLLAKRTLPIFLFGESARNRERRDFRVFRQFHHLNLPELLNEEEWQPDLGSVDFDPEVGVAVVGARLFHLNFAIYFDTEDIELIDELSKVHERLDAEENGEMHGNWTFEEISRLLKQVNTFVDDRPDKKVVRMLCNVPDYTRTRLTDLVEVFSNEAALLGIETVGSKILGHLPCEALIECESSVPIDELKIGSQVEALRLNAIEPFNMKRQILDFYVNRR
ncbi:MAG: hypothetical protein ACRBF0_06700 [Calditrichia bacterium]